MTRATGLFIFFPSSIGQGDTLGINKGPRGEEKSTHTPRNREKYIKKEDQHEAKIRSNPDTVGDNGDPPGSGSSGRQHLSGAEFSRKAPL